MIITVVLIALVLAAIGYVLASRIKGQPVNIRRLLVLPAVLTAMGILELAGSVSGGVGPWDAVLLAAGLLAAAGLGAARGATVAVFVKDDRWWLRYRLATLALWGATVAVRVGLTVLAHWAGATVATSGPALLLSAGATLLAEGAMVAQRANTSGGRQWQSWVSAKHAPLR
ncbi:MAG TPA: hypothetical protein VIC62_10875 [Nakamurella sp.]|jgi:hypothetical protein